MRTAVEYVLSALAVAAMISTAGLFGWYAGRFIHGKIYHDAVVVQYSTYQPGRVVACWELQDTPVTYDSTGVSWTNALGLTVRVGGSYAVTEVHDGDWHTAARTLGVDVERCKYGAYGHFTPTFPPGPRRYDL